MTTHTGHTPIDWDNLYVGAAFTFPGMPSDVEIVHWLGRSLVSPLVQILESETGTIYKKPIGILKHWPEQDKATGKESAS